MLTLRRLRTRRGALRTLAVVALLTIASLLAPATVPVSAEGAPALDAAVRATLDEIDAHGFNPATGSLFINWSVDDPARSNLPDGSPARRDELTDLRDVLNMVWYQRRHSGDRSQAAALARLMPPLRDKVVHYSSDKGWVYWQFLQLAALTGDAFWTQRAQAFAGHLQGIVDPLTGVVHGHISADGHQPACPDGYRVDHDLEGGLALVDAGTRFRDPTWVAVGMREALTVVAQAYDTTYHLFNHTVCGGAPANREAKLGEQADEVLALLDTGAATGVPLLTALATQMLDGLAANPTRLHDTVTGGFFFEFDLGTQQVSSSYKEVRQLTLLTALHRANALQGGRYAALEAEMTGVALRMQQRTPLTGYPYRETVDFAYYRGERYITTEAAGIAAEALQSILDTAPATAMAPLAPLPLPSPPAAVAPAVPPAPPPRPLPAAPPLALPRLPAVQAPAAAPPTAGPAPAPESPGGRAARLSALRGALRLC
ncbi:MAG TPA: hypothetical protein VGP96_07240 [Candidatus Dormibacteraeota bacterium]|nr:hypothetical protein [Candidatus Dormibacteraeota bacterium]